MEPMTRGLVAYQSEAGVAHIALTNPPVNAYSFEMMCDLDEAIIKARFDESAHVIVISGAGEKFFCAGADINMLQTVTKSFKYNFCLHANETLRRLENTPKLVIAAIQGHCVGGGLEVALAADLRFAAEGKYKLGLPEVALGVLPGTGGTQRLARLLGASKSMELMCEGSLFGVDRAKELGVVNKVLPNDDFLATVLKEAQMFCPPHRASMSVGLIKRAVQTGVELSLDAGLALERELQQRLFASDDAAEGISANLEKRTPKFSGQ